MSWDQLTGLVTAFLSMIATGFAAFATWKGPQVAAEQAEKLRQRSEKEQERRRVKLNVFGQLMQERASLTSLMAVQALNLIDIAFADCRPVREAWAELYQGFSASPLPPAHVREERLRKLLGAMASDLGLGDSLRLDDFARVYYPVVLAEEEEIRHKERKARLLQLTRTEGPSANVAVSTSSAASSPYPPPP